ncbi:MAG: DNA recombination protein RmuC [Chloroflexi bacterium]|jgi:DNA recombination protein RmuC|nr:DNA recombination protein RmuC [Chloroflexota bacterium]
MNDLLIYGLVFSGGIAIGVAITIIITRVYKPYYKQDMLAISGEVQKNLAAFTDVATQTAVDHLVKMSGQLVTAQSQLSEQNIEGKKALIDQSIREVRDNLKGLETLLGGLEKDRAQAYGQLLSQLKTASEQTIKLSETTGKLQAALGNTRVRGQWGERMADDILASIGFLEGTNYRKQQVDATGGSRPDYTFLLPNRLVLNMDVKFPLDNYLKYIDTESEADREGFKAAFLKDARQRVKEVTTRDYINPEQNTVDYVLVLIPNEQVYRFINENDSSMLDYALQSKVVLCSPVTLYAVLALINQAAKNFKMERGLAEIITQIRLFVAQWQKFVDSMDKMGRKLQDAQKEFESLSGTRKNMLERPMLRIDQLRHESDIKELDVIDIEPSPSEPPLPE